jgi:small subunit ribosomal protein S6
MERFFKIDDNVMKFMTVLLDEDADLDAIQAELAEKAAKDDQATDEEASDTAKESDASEDDSEPEEEEEKE